MSELDAAVLIAGEASGPALVLDQTLSFWGGFDPVNGEIIDVHHAQFGARVAGNVLCIPRSKGSAGTPGGIAETLRRGSGPRAFVLGERDVNISIGVLVANRLYGLQVHQTLSVYVYIYIYIYILWHVKRPEYQTKRFVYGSPLLVININSCFLYSNMNRSR